MTEDNWQTREIVNQILLFFALGVRERLVAGQSTIEIPSPLPPFRGTQAEKKLRSSWEECAKLSLSNDKNEKALGKYLDSHYDNIRNSKIKVVPHWSIGDVVEWWISSSLLLAGWGVFRTTSGVREGGSEAGRQQPSDSSETKKEKLLWSKTVNRLWLEDDEVYPPIWCADHADLWPHLEPPPAIWPKLWKDPAKNADQCKAAFLEWCGDPRRELNANAMAADPLPLEGWANKYKDRQRDFARLSRKLLRRRCQFSPEPVENADFRPDYWQIATLKQSPEKLLVLRQPLVEIDGDKKTLVAHGWLVSPWPETILQQYQTDVVTPEPRSASFKRAIDAAARAWIKDNEKNQSLAPLLLCNFSGVEKGVGARVVNAMERRASVVRLAVFESVGMGLKRVRKALNAEGFLFQSASAGAGIDRRIPFGAGSVPQATAQMPINRLRRIDSTLEVDVGFFGPPACCPDELLSVIEELDWQLWALREISRDSGSEKIASLVKDINDNLNWESVKLTLLDLDTKTPVAAEVLAAAFTKLHAARFMIDSTDSSGEDESRPVRSLLVNLIKRVEEAVLQLLFEVDPDKQGGLYPPRMDDYSIDLAMWHRERDGDGRGPDPRAAMWKVAWEISSVQFGKMVRESRPKDDCFKAVFSAGESASKADVRILEEMVMVCTTKTDLPRVSFWQPLRADVVAALNERRQPDFALAIESLRKSWNGEAAQSFHEMVKAAVGGQEWAFGTLKLLNEDTRFKFKCYPRVELDERRASLPQATVEEQLEWRDDETVPINDDIEVFYASAPNHSHRVVSRGLPVPLSAEACAAELEAVVREGPPEVIAAAKAVRTATDRRRTFGDAVPDPLDAVVRASNALIDAGNALAQAEPDATWTMAAFNTLLKWCEATRCEIIPHDWHPSRGTPVNNHKLTLDRFGFHNAVPSGDIVVERFGARNAAGEEVSKLEAYVSAGPEPAGFRAVSETAKALTGENDSLKRFRQCVLDFPKRLLAGQTETAISTGLFDLVWKAKLSDPDQAVVEAAVQAVHQLLEQTYSLVLFRPKTIGEYPETWLRTTDGNTPRGNRVELLRPGIRTRDNKLACPAIVKAE